MSQGGPPPGLCGNCRHARVIQNRRGSRFYLCLLSKRDPRFRKYPVLPVLECAGFRAKPPEAPSETAGGTVAPGPERS